MFNRNYPTRKYTLIDPYTKCICLIPYVLYIQSVYTIQSRTSFI